MTIDPNAAARDTLRVAYQTAGINPTDRLLDVIVDAVTAGGPADRAQAIADVATYADLPWGTATKLVDLAREALGDAGLR